MCCHVTVAYEGGGREPLAKVCTGGPLKLGKARKWVLPSSVQKKLNPSNAGFNPKRPSDRLLSYRTIRQ